MGHVVVVQCVTSSIILPTALAERMNNHQMDIDQLHFNMEGLLTELMDLSRQNNKLMTAKDLDLIVIHDLDVQLKEYKWKYKQAKTELRSVKGTSAPFVYHLFLVVNFNFIATSQLFLQAPKLDNQLPAPNLSRWRPPRYTCNSIHISH